MFRRSEAFMNFESTFLLVTQILKYLLVVLMEVLSSGIWVGELATRWVDNMR